MSAPMPDFAMPSEAAERRGIRGVQRPSGPTMRRGIGIAVVVVVVGILGIVAVPALVEQQRGRDAVAVVERYAAAIADADVDAARAEQPDVAERGDVETMASLAPASALQVEDVALVSIDDESAVVRVEHAIGPDRGSSEVLLEDRGGWVVIDGLLALTDVDETFARVLGGGVEPGRTWLLPGRYDLGEVRLGAVDVLPAAFAIVPPPVGSTLPAPTFEAVPTVQTASAALDQIDEVLAACGAQPVDDCPPPAAAVSDVPPFMQWSIDLATRSGTLDVTVTTAVAGDAPGVTEIVTTPLRFGVAIADDLQSVAFEQLPTTGALP